MDDLASLLPEELGPFRYVALLFIGVIFLAPQLRELWEQVAGVRLAENERLRLERLKLRLEIDVLLYNHPFLSLSDAERTMLTPYDPTTTRQREPASPSAPPSPPARSGRRWQIALGALGGSTFCGLLLLLMATVSVDEDTPGAIGGLALLAPFFVAVSAGASVVLPGRGPGRSFVVGFLSPITILLLLSLVL